MRENIFKRIVSTITLVAFMVTSVIGPTTANAGTTVDIAPASGITSNWVSWSSNTNNWISMPNLRGYGTGVIWPRSINYQKIAESVWEPDPNDPMQSRMNWKMIDGERWITNAREELGMRGVRSDEISNRIGAMPKTAAYVFAMYAPDTAELVIEVHKVEKTTDGKLVVYRGDYTPHHGEFNRWKRDYMTPAEASDPAAVGKNPFAAFCGNGNCSNYATVNKADKVFRNMSWEAVGVAVGAAMKASDAHVGYIASTQTRFTQQVKKSGGAFKKKVKVTIQGFAKPQWFVATPLEVQPEGGMSSICVTSTGTTNALGSTSSCDSQYHVVSSGVSIMSWSGGNMPQTEEMLYNYVYKKSSFTVLAFTILTFALTWGLASALATAIGPVAVTSGGFAATATIAPLATAALGAGIYASTAVLTGAGITDAQAGWAGSTGNGVLKPNQGTLDRHNRGLNQGIHNMQIESRVGTGLQGVQTLYKGTCPEDWTAAACRADGRDPGSMHRPDSYRESNVVLQLRAAEERCKATGLTGKALAQCAAPKSGAWTIETGL